jgi:hypothetical protein
MGAQITDEQLSEFLQRTEQAAAAYMRGDIERYLALPTTPVGSPYSPVRWPTQQARTANRGRTGLGRHVPRR